MIGQAECGESIRESGKLQTLDVNTLTAMCLKTNNLVSIRQGNKQCNATPQVTDNLWFHTRLAKGSIKKQG